MTAVHIIAAMDARGVIGRTSKACTSIAHEPSHWPGWAPGVSLCNLCGNEGSTVTGARPGRVPCNDLPWGRAYPEIDARFEATTMGHAVIVGRRTAESMGKVWPLKGRSNVMITSRVKPGDLESTREGEYFAPDLAGALSWGEFYNPRGKTFVIGGVRPFTEALPIADELDLTLIGREWPGDVKFPEWESFVDDPRSLGHGPVIARTSSGLDFECVSREPCPTNTDLTWTKWVRHEEQKGGG